MTLNMCFILTSFTVNISKILDDFAFKDFRNRCRFRQSVKIKHIGTETFFYVRPNLTSKKLNKNSFRPNIDFSFSSSDLPKILKYLIVRSKCHSKWYSYASFKGLYLPELIAVPFYVIKISARQTTLLTANFLKITFSSSRQEK